MALKLFKNLLPKSFFGRGLLIVAMPVILIQLVTTFLFFNRHWENVTRHRAHALAGEVAFISYLVANENEKGKEIALNLFKAHTDIQAEYKPGEHIANAMKSESFSEFQQALYQELVMPFAMRADDESIDIDIQLEGGSLELKAPSKRLESPTTTIFILGITGASFVFPCIALLFLRNQVRPIRELAEAAERFGKGRDIEDFKPSGALEVRRAGRAFLVMRERIRRQIRTRTEMLASISHDLRTPLTRMKLQLAMLPQTQETLELAGDVEQMQGMINEYLDFARGSGGEESLSMDLKIILQDIANDYLRMNANVVCAQEEDIILELRMNAFRRLMHNVIDNALRHGTKCAISARTVAAKAEITVDDNGAGIPLEKREEVFRPFTRLDPARNVNAGGVGLGLTIARDIALKAGGNISLDTSPMGGLRVVIRLPL